MTRTAFIFRRTVLAPAVGVAAVLCVAPAGAQQQQASERPYTLGIGLGVAARPGGSIGSLGLGTIEFGTPWRNAGVRLDGAFTSWPGKTSGGRLTSFTSNLVYSRRLGVFAPYLIGGIGGYAQQGTGTSFGVNGGVGTKALLGRLQPFIELREHVWSADRSHRATPLTLGVSF
jgi:hypothetical protein